MPADPSAPVMFATATTPNRAGTLLEAEIVRPTAGLLVVAEGLGEPGSITNGETYPPRRTFDPLPARFDGSTPVVLAVGADRPGEYDGLGVVLKWRDDDGDTHVDYRAVGFRVCVGADECQEVSSVTSRIRALDVNEVLDECTA